MQEIQVKDKISLFLDVLLSGRCSENSRFCLQGIKEKRDRRKLSLEERIADQDSPGAWRPMWMDYPAAGGEGLVERIEGLSLQVMKQLEATLKRGYMLSISMNSFSGDERRLRSVSGIRAHVLDIDEYLSDAEAQALEEALMPSVSVRTREGEGGCRRHFWFIWEDAGEELNRWMDEQYMGILRALSVRAQEVLGRDIKIDDGISAEKVIRMPYSFNMKDYFSAPREERCEELVYQVNFDSFLAKGYEWAFKKIAFCIQSLADRGISEEALDEACCGVKDRTPREPKDVDLSTTFDGVREGDRHSTMLSRANVIINQLGNKKSWAWAIFREDNTKNDPPLDDGELERIFEDAWRYQQERLEVVNKESQREGALVNRDLNEKSREALSRLKEVREGLDEGRGGYEHAYDYSYLGDVLSDVSIMRRVGLRHKDMVYYNTDSGETLSYSQEAGEFCEDSGSLFAFIDDTLDSMKGEPAVVEEFIEVGKDGKTQLNTKRLNKFFEAKKSSTKVKGFQDLAKMMPEFMITSQAFDNDPDLILVQGGVIDLRQKNKLLEYDKAYRFRHKARAEFCYESYLQNLNELNDRTDYLSMNRWSRFVWEIMDGDLDMCKFLQKAFGYALQGGLEEQVLFFFEGGGCNGKSLCLETVKHALGGYGASLGANLLCDEDKRTSTPGLSKIAGLQGKRLVVCSELGRRDKLDESFVKDITVGDSIQAKHYYKPMFDYRPQFSTFLQGNHKPKIGGGDVGIWRRIIDVPFGVDFRGREDRGLDKRLQSREGLRDVFNWALAGHELYLREGLSLKMPEKVIDAKEDYILKMNPFKSFSDRCLVKVDKVYETEPIETEVVYKVYTDWCERKGVEPKNRTWFGRAMIEAGFFRARYKKNGVSMRGYKGLALIDVEGAKN